MISWKTYKQAVAEYSLLAPRTVPYSLSLVANQTQYTLPEGTTDVVIFPTGERVPLFEIVTATDETPRWEYYDGTLYVHPAPTDPSTVTVLLEARYLPNEVSQTFPDLPVEHSPYVDMLEQAISMESAISNPNGKPKKYQVGQTVVERAEAAEGDRRALAQSLRQKVEAALSRSVALWG